MRIHGRACVCVCRTDVGLGPKSTSAARCITDFRVVGSSCCASSTPFTSRGERSLRRAGAAVVTVRSACAGAFYWSLFVLCFRANTVSCHARLGVRAKTARLRWRASDLQPTTNERASRITARRQHRHRIPIRSCPRCTRRLVPLFSCSSSPLFFLLRGPCPPSLHLPSMRQVSSTPPPLALHALHASLVAGVGLHIYRNGI